MNRSQQDHQPKRLRRLSVIYSRSRPVLFITMCSHARRPCLANAEVHEAFRIFSGRSPDLAAVWVGEYVLMPDHLHVLISAEGSGTVSRWVGSLKKSLAVVLRSKGYRAPYWQSGFFDHVLRNGEKYRGVWDYVQLNPTNAGLTEPGAAWPFRGRIHEIRWDDHAVR